MNLIVVLLVLRTAIVLGANLATNVFRLLEHNPAHHLWTTVTLHVTTILPPQFLTVQRVGFLRSFLPQLQVAF